MKSVEEKISVVKINSNRECVGCPYVNTCKKILETMLPKTNINCAGVIKCHDIGLFK